MRRPEIRYTDYLTPQELLMIGGSPDFLEGDKVYVPEVFSKRLLNWKEADVIRQAMKTTDIPGIMLGLLGKEVEGLNLKLKLAKLKDGKTVADPVIVEIKDNFVGGKTVQKMIERRDLTRQFYRVFEEKGMDLHLRGRRMHNEGQVMSPSSEHKG